MMGSRMGDAPPTRRELEDEGSALPNPNAVGHNNPNWEPEDEDYGS
jgi:hypothetical protein